MDLDILAAVLASHCTERIRLLLSYWETETHFGNSKARDFRSGKFFMAHTNALARNLSSFYFVFMKYRITPLFLVHSIFIIESHQICSLDHEIVVSVPQVVILFEHNFFTSQLLKDYPEQQILLSSSPYTFS